ncbi:MAG: type I polyketide synthase, partial [Planctomycetia bacterium]
MSEDAEPIAIVGIGCRFPGGVADPNSLWQKMIQGFDAVAEIPDDRWSIRSFYDPEVGRPMKSCSKWAALLPDVGMFDADFFGISDSEARVIDPQQRLLLETAWEAMEDGGYVPDPRGEQTGVFVGISTHDYEVLQGSVLDRREVCPYSSTGVAASIAANRISYCFNFTGPSFSVDTACSSSLLAVHLACQSLSRRECGVALAAGVGCLLGPNNFIAFSSMGVLSPDGRCRAFDARANGFVRGEGVGAILLKPLRDALACGDRIYATIIGTGTNQDGRTRGLALPSRESQVALLRSTCRQAGVSPHDVVYVEAHGTGTAVGDPVEADALGEVFGSGRAPGRELLIGSIKTNIGHLEAGAGIAGIIKCALCLKHGAVPQNLHFEQPNPAIDFERWRLKVPVRTEPLPALTDDGQPASWLAGVNSFGFGGSNAFALLRSQPDRSEPVVARGTSGGDDAGTHLLPISARSEKGLRALAERYEELLGAPAWESPEALRDLVSASIHRRRHHEHRVTVVGRSRDELHRGLAAFSRGDLPAGVWSAEARPQPGPVFVFSGQGAQWPAMARDLYDREPVFRAMLERCHDALAAMGGWSLVDEMLAEAPESRMDDTAIAQPAIFALQVSLAALWAHWGIRPAAVVGHSVGEVAAAHVAGAFDLATAMKVIFHRGATMQSVASSGGMLAAALTEDEARAVIAPYADAVCVGAVNSPHSVTLSGDPATLGAIAAQLEARGCWQRHVPVNYAFHSKRMDAVRQPLLSSLDGVVPEIARLPLFSTVTGERVSGTELNAEYWWHNVRQAVRFGPAIGNLAQEGYATFVEVSGHPVLSTSIRQCLQHALPDESWDVLPSLRKGEDGLQAMMGSLGALHCLGHEVSWDSIAPRSACRHVPLPRTAWQHRKHWNESGEHARARVASTSHPLLHRRVNTPGTSWLSTADIRLVPYLRDHSVNGRALFPAAGHVELGLAVAAEMFPGQPCCLRDVDIESALFLGDGAPGTSLQIRFDPAGNEFGVYSNVGADEDGWTRRAKGVVRPMRSMASLGVEEIARTQERCAEEVEAAAFY